MSTAEKICHLDKDYYKLVEHMSQLPHKILQHHYLEALPQIILHELGHNHTGFGFKRAVYLVDNPDFDHLVGSAGFCCEECKHHKENMWHEPHTFVEDMKEAQFHNEMRKIIRQSLKRKDIDLNNHNDVKELGRYLGFACPDSFSWNMKHGNHGILIFEKE